MRIVVTENGPKSPPKETNPYKWEVLIAVVPGTVMCAMDFGIAYIAFPTMISVFTGYKHDLIEYPGGSGSPVHSVFSIEYSMIN